MDGVYCPACGSDNTSGTGAYSDGCGDFGTGVCEDYECLECGEVFENETPVSFFGDDNG